MADDASTPFLARALVSGALLWEHGRCLHVCGAKEARDEGTYTARVTTFVALDEANGVPDVVARAVQLRLWDREALVHMQPASRAR
jgi:hypothetical protein